MGSKYGLRDVKCPAAWATRLGDTVLASEAVDTAKSSFPYLNFRWSRLSSPLGTDYESVCLKIESILNLHNLTPITRMLDNAEVRMFLSSPSGQLTTQRQKYIFQVGRYVLEVS